MDAIKSPEGLPIPNPEISPKEGITWEERLIRRMPEMLGFVGAISLEGIRASLVNPRSSPTSAMVPPSMRQIEPMLSPQEHPLAFGLLGNSGNFMDGYYYSFILNNTLDFLTANLPIRIPERVKLGFTCATISCMIAAVEAGWIWGTRTPDFNDIPAGVVGTLAYTGARILGSKLFNSSLARKAQSPKGLD